MQTELEDKVANYIKSYDLIPIDGSIVIAVSGGADSVCMVYLLKRINKELSNGRKIYLAHLNHKLRGAEADGDAEFVKNLAFELDLPLLIKEVDINKLANELQGSVEEIARNERYNFLKNSAESVEAPYIATAHTADDNAETMLQRIVRGTGLLGLRGIMPKRLIAQDSDIMLIRPLLSLWKDEILDYLKQNKISYRIDSSNFEKKHFRNKIRLELIPLLEEGYNKQVKKALINLSEIAGKSCDMVNDISTNALKNVVLETNDNQFVLDNNALANETDIVIQNIVMELLGKLNTPLKQIGNVHYNDIVNFVKGCNHKALRNLPGGLKLFKRDARLIIQYSTNRVEPATIPPKEFKKIDIAMPGSTELPETNAGIVTEIVKNENGFLERFKANKTQYEEAVDLAKIELPLFAGIRKPGARFWPIGADGPKKIKDIFIDKKIPKDERGSTPIVMCKNFPVWIVGVRVDHRARITDTTEKILIIRYLPTM